MPNSGKPGVMRDPDTMKSGHHYCSLCPFHHKSVDAMLDHLRKKHNMDKRLIKAERRGRL